MQNHITDAIEQTLEKTVAAIQTLHHLIDTTLPLAVDILASCKGRVVVTGIGKSGHIAAKLSATFSSLGIPALFLHPAEALHGDLGMLLSHDVLVAISNSGENKELNKIIVHAKKKQVPIIAITGNAQSSLATISNVALVFAISHEGSPFNTAPMASATSSLVIGHMLATGVCTKKGFTEKDFATLHPAGSLGLKLQSVASIMRPDADCPLVPLIARLHDILKEMTEKKNIGVTGVIDQEGVLVGVISDGDIRRYLLQHEVHDAMAQDVMSRHPKTIDRDATLYEAIRLMETHKITSLFVCDKDHMPCGIIHMHDIVAAEII